MGPREAPGRLTAASRCPYVPAVLSRQSITLQGLRFHALVGVLPHEEMHPQPLEMDVTVWLHASSSEDTTVALDYRDLYSAMAAAVGAAPVRFLEELVQRAASSVLALGPVSRVRIAARKPHVALGGPLGYAEVAIERDRDA